MAEAKKKSATKSTAKAADKPKAATKTADKAVEEKKKLKIIKEQVEEIVNTEAKEIVDEAKAEESVILSESEESKVEDGSDLSTSPQDDKGGAKATAKAGKHSAKAIKEAEAKEAKEARKQAPAEEKAEADVKPKREQKPARSKLERRSKAYRQAYQTIDKTKTYELKEALDVAIKSSTVKFDATVELHINLNVDPRQADQNIRGTVVLPAGTGNSVRVAVFADDEDVKKAKAAGADIAGSDEFLKQLDKGTLDFDVLISTPVNMAKLGKYARLLGPKGLMPNPKSGTVTPDVAKAVSEAKAGRVEYRVDSTGIVHVGVGKVSFGTGKLEENTQAVISSIKAAKPASIKGIYIKSAFVTSSMGPSVKLSI